MFTPTARRPPERCAPAGSGRIWFLSADEPWMIYQTINMQGSETDQDAGSHRYSRESPGGRLVRSAREMPYFGPLPAFGLAPRRVRIMLDKWPLVVHRDKFILVTVITERNEPLIN